MCNIEGAFQNTKSLISSLYLDPVSLLEELLLRGLVKLSFNHFFFFSFSLKAVCLFHIHEP